MTDDSGERAARLLPSEQAGRFLKRRAPVGDEVVGCHWFDEQAGADFGERWRSSLDTSYAVINTTPAAG